MAKVADAIREPGTDLKHDEWVMARQALNVAIFLCDRVGDTAVVDLLLLAKRALERRS